NHRGDLLFEIGGRQINRPCDFQAAACLLCGLDGQMRTLLTVNAAHEQQVIFFLLIIGKIIYIESIVDRADPVQLQVALSLFSTYRDELESPGNGFVNRGPDLMWAYVHSCDRRHFTEVKRGQSKAEEVIVNDVKIP